MEQLSLLKPIILVIGMFFSSKRCLNELNKLTALPFSTTTVSSKASVTSYFFKSKYRIAIAKICVIKASVHRRSQGGPKGPWSPLNFKFNYKTVSKKSKHKFFRASAGTSKFIVDF